MRLRYLWLLPLVVLPAAMLACGGDDDVDDGTPTSTATSTPFETAEPTPVGITFEQVFAAIESFHISAATQIDGLRYKPDYTLTTIRQCNGENIPAGVSLPDFIIGACWSVGKHIADFANDNANPEARNLVFFVHQLLLSRTDQMYGEGLFDSVPEVTNPGGARAYAETAWAENVPPVQ